MNKKLKMLGLLGGFAALGTPFVHAQDKATLDLLVQKGTITQADEDSLMKSAAVIVTPKDKAVKSLKLEGMIQAQYDWLTTKDAGAGPNPPGVSQFLLRRVYLGAVADLGNGWGGELLMDFAGTEAGNAPAGGTQSQANNANFGQNLFEKVIITKKVDDFGMASIGFRKVNFTQEEITPSSDVKPIERSIASRYFDESYGTNTTRRVGFADRHTGLFWDGTVQGVDGLTYNLAVTNGVQNGDTNYGSLGGYNKFGVWGGVGYGQKAADTTGLSWKTGLQLGYSGDENSVNAGVAANAPAGTPNQSNSEWGVNPYVWVNIDNFDLAAEFIMVNVQNGRSADGALPTSTATPYGFNFTPSYKINDEWELVGRLSSLDSNGRGIAISDVVRDASNTVTTPGVSLASTQLYDKALSGYIGVNWYIIGNSLKLSLGYEYDQFSGRTGAAGFIGSDGPKAEVSGVRARMQLQF